MDDIKILKNTVQIKNNILIVFDNMIADMLSNKKRNTVVTELFIKGRKLNISLAFIMQFYIAASKNIRLNSTHYFAMNLYKECTAKPYSFLIYTTLASDNFLHFRKNLLERM